MSCETGSCGLPSTTQFMLYVQNANPLSNFVAPPSPDRDNVPNSYVISSVDLTITVDGAPLAGSAETFTPPPSAQPPSASGRWPSTVVCSPPTGPAPCTTVQNPAILPGETTVGLFIGWSHGSTEPNGKYVFTFVMHGTLNGTEIDLNAASAQIVMKTATTPGWASAAPMSTARSAFATAAGPDGRIYALGGFGFSNGTILNSVEVYSPKSNTWASAASMPTARYGLAAATGQDGRIYAIGGNNGTDLSTVEAYTPTTNNWTTLAPMPTARRILAATTGPDGRIYAMGGYSDSAGGYLSTVEAYTPSNNSWATLASMPTTRDGLAAATGPDGRIYALGGDTDLSTAEAYDPGTGSWKTVSPMPTGRYALAAATGPDGRIYAIGGDLGGSALSTVEAYTAGTDTWTTVASMPTGRRGLGAAAGGDGRVYAIGGNNGSDLSTVEAYTP
ncbi:MAG TPA: kelch repeat-containing protein [Candidatus Dormibacteraeota bacterium]